MGEARCRRTLWGVVVLVLAITGAGCIAWDAIPAKTLPAESTAFTFGFTTSKDLPTPLPFLGYRYSPAERWDVGVAILEWLTVMMDGRYQLLVSDQHFVDSTVELGIGYGIWPDPLLFGGIALGVPIGEKVNPYVRYRYVSVSLVVADLEDSFEGFTADIDYVQQLSVGVQIGMGEKFAVIPELMMFPDYPDLTLFNFAFSFGKW